MNKILSCTIVEPKLAAPIVVGINVVSAGMYAAMAVAIVVLLIRGRK